jgi:hypothetical protein
MSSGSPPTTCDVPLSSKDVAGKMLSFQFLLEIKETLHRLQQRLQNVKICP